MGSITPQKSSTLWSLSAPFPPTLGWTPTAHERDLEQAIIDRLEAFLLEMGKGFCFVAQMYLPTEEELRVALTRERDEAERVLRNTADESPLFT